MTDLEYLKGKGKQLVADIAPSGVDAMDKYLDAEYQVNQKYQLVEKLGLHLTPPCKKILDISTCGGWLPWILNMYEHDVWYTDNTLERNPIPERLREALGLDLCYHFAYPKIPVKQRKHPKHIYIMQNLPWPGKFEVIFACNVSPLSHFSPEQLHDFIRNCLHHLVDGGYLYLAINRGVNMQLLNTFENHYNMNPLLKGWRIWK